MTALTVFSAEDALPLLQTSDPVEIARHLGQIGMGFERWPLMERLSPGASPADILALYAGPIGRICESGGYATADVVRLYPDHPDRGILRRKFLDEHRHSEDEVRFFVEGSGAFYIHAEDRVHQVVCTAGDLLRVPANVRHWFDMGPRPHFTALRIFTNPEGWVAQFSGDPIAGRFPYYGDAPDGLA